MMPSDIVGFWRDAGVAKWFRGGAAFDEDCRSRFGEAHHVAARRKMDIWMREPDGALALVLLLDQIPRNIFRNSAHAFATDPLARMHASTAIAAGFDARVDPDLRLFFYLPFEHSESMDDQDRSVALFKSIGPGVFLDYAVVHRDVIATFGRFPHRNHVLGRENTPEEQAWLNAGGGF
ncbi:MAG: DUF924 family protein [Thermomonas sp.]|uniref:DUF924 family protein n=1 Tax=Thermomonas sp. TaxID=1971895 RepID=UPI00260CA006|nr:DUF924 family protein [Thermomonas sp.]MCC7096927.1 DUF924 family protein [Thermomonas sp.]